MKKYFFLAATFIFIAAISNAQMVQKQPLKTNTTNQPSLNHSSTNGSKVGSSVSSVSPAKTSMTNSSHQSSSTAIKRKHHKKSTPKKTGSK